MLPILFWLLLGSPLVAHETQQVTLVVSPHFVTSRPPKVKASITISLDERNRGACLVWEGENEASSHCWEHLDERDFPPHIEFPVVLHFEGIYHFQLILQRTDKEVRSDIQEVEVH